MADIDIDNLLEELDLDSPAVTPSVATKTAPAKSFGRDDSDNSPEPSPTCRPCDGGRGGSQAPSGGSETLDDLLDDLDCVDDTPPIASTVERGAGHGGIVTHVGAGVPSGGGSTRKCFPVCLAGSHDEHGISPGRGCDNLRCTKCDFQVLRVVDSKWADDAEYLFFRNYHPNLDKLRSKLVRAPGHCCYCCQCTWRSTAELAPLDKSPDMRWVCGGHRF